MITLQQYITQWIYLILAWFRSLYDRFFGTVLTLDSGLEVRLGKQLAEGGFSVVFYARSTTNNPHKLYALKRIHCHDFETRQQCKNEAEVHYAIHHTKSIHAKYCMPLLGMTPSSLSLSSSSTSPVSTVGGGNHDTSSPYCYMLFPFFPHSLRAEVNRRIFHTPELVSSSSSTMTTPSPWSNSGGEPTVLELFQHLTEGVAVLHAAGYTHRDIKLENILLGGSNPSHLVHPVLMDFGSAGPLSRPIRSRNEALDVADQASSHTTLPYRPPELFPGELRYEQSGVENQEQVLDYTQTDVWMLGCTFFAILYGASPFEMEFARPPRRGQERNHSWIRIVDCTQLKVLGNLPKPHPNTPPAHWYTKEIIELIEWMLNKDRHQRPTLVQVLSRIQNLKQHPHQADIEDPAVIDLGF